MKYFFSEIEEVTLTFGDIRVNRDGMEFISIYFERPTENGFDFLESSLPALEKKKSHGFTAEESARLLDYARTNSFLIWEIAREDGQRDVASSCRDLIFDNFSRSPRLDKKFFYGAQQKSNSHQRFEQNFEMACGEQKFRRKEMGRTFQVRGGSLTMPRIYDPKYPGGFIEVEHINGYLLPGPDIYVEPRSTPFFRVPPMIAGSMPVDDGNLLLTPEEKDELIKRNPLAEKWIRPFVGSREFINRIARFCLWLEGCPPDELRKMPLVYERVKNVREFRLKSKKAATRKLANRPTLFAERRQPITNYLVVPRVSSSRRRYVPIDFLTPDIIAGDAVQFIPDANLFLFGVLTSSIHMAWVRLVAGRLRNDYRYSNTICYNPFPFPLFYLDSDKPRVEKTAQKILDVRKNYPNASYADLYDELSMPSDLRKAHAENDAAVLSLYKRLSPDMDEMTLQVRLLYMYDALRNHFGEGDEYDE